MAAPDIFDELGERDVALFDELPLWSSLAGQFLLEHVPLTARRALDLGCGAGFPLLELAERLGPGATVAGVDPWRLALARARQKVATWRVPYAHPVCGDGASLPFRDGAFDLVVSNLGVNNFADAAAVFAECRRALRPGGALALTSNVTGHMRELYVAFESVLASDPAALERLRRNVAHRGTPGSIAVLLEAAGFRIAASHVREVTMRFASGTALLEHHFIRFGFRPGWEEVAGSRETLARLRDELDRVAAAAGELLLTVPLVYVEARRS
jgi:SAM-dependent methyltransferase